MAKRKSISNGAGTSSPSINILKAISRVPSSSALKVRGSGELKPLAPGQGLAATPLRFGSPSSRGSAGARKKTESSWTGLLGNIAGGGVSDLLGGGILSSGLDHLIGGFENLFGGGSTASQALTTFELADTQEQSIVVNNGQPTSASANPSGMYNNSTAQVSQVSRASVVQTVRNALLTSSSLNDVIGEL